MSNVIIVGTLHLKLTRKNDLLKILEDIKPDQLLLELPEDETQRESAIEISDDMGFADTWAKTKNIPVGYFDSTEGVLRDDVLKDDDEYNRLVRRQIQEAQAFDWQELNKKGPWCEGRLALVEQELWKKFIDPRKWEAREEKMLENIKRLRATSGTILILTGVGHLDFFERELPEAELPFRY